MASGKSDGFEDDILQLLFRNVVQGAVSALNITAGAAANLYITLSTAVLDDTSTQATSEVSYTGWLGRLILAQGTANWTKADNETAQNASALTFGKRENTGTLTAQSTNIGTSATGAGNPMYWGALDSNLEIGINVNPQFAVNALKIREQ